MGDVSLARRVAERLDYLMRTGHPDGTGPTDYAAVAEASHAYAKEHGGGPTISHQGVFNLRNEKTANPSVNTLEALSHVYGVPVTYFLDEPDQTKHAAPDGAKRSEPAPDPEAVLTRLMLLVSIVERRDLDGSYTDQELARLVRERGGHITEDDIVRLRGGDWQDHLFSRLGAFATTIGVPPAFFFDDEVAAKVADDLKLLSALKGIGARQVAMRRVAELDEDALSALTPMIEHLSSRKKT
ncbi:transcriptional regulator with XRE-family HTH domain [Streptacidiphilus sp. MAP12-20]|uniref:hypothetical protein n=1 Tax=Streptacidiphilus sp. MAP12-20 TaxID=3156299 RepID=UPI003518C572